MHVTDPYQLKMTQVCSENLVTYRPEDGSLSDLGPSLQVPEPTVLAEALDQVYETVIGKEVRHLLAPRDPCFVEVHVQVREDNGVPEALQRPFQVWKVLQHQQR